MKETRRQILEIRRILAWIEGCNGYHESEPELWLDERLRQIRLALEAMETEVGKVHGSHIGESV